jgi:hypothetical protein
MNWKGFGRMWLRPSRSISRSFACRDLGKSRKIMFTITGIPVEDRNVNLHNTNSEHYRYPSPLSLTAKDLKGVGILDIFAAHMVRRCFVAQTVWARSGRNSGVLCAISPEVGHTCKETDRIGTFVWRRGFWRISRTFRSNLLAPSSG